MSNNFYDKEYKHPIKCFYDPCYRTGDFYKICYLNRNALGCESFDPEDTLFSVVNRSEGNIIYFVDSLGKELKLKPIKIEIYVAKNTPLLYFKDMDRDDNFLLIYDSDASLIVPDYTEDYGMYLSSYSFVPNYKEKDNIINPHLYKDVKPWTDEELEIVRIRSTENPFYKCEEYR